MSHEILVNTETGAASIVYIGETPWHGYGEHFTEPIPLTATRAMEIIESGFEVGMTPNLSIRPDGEPVAVESATIWRPPLPRYGITEYLELGTVGPDYALLQTREIAEMLDEVADFEGEQKAVTDFWPVLTHGMISNATRMFYSLNGGSFGVKEPRGRRSEDVDRVVSILDDKKGTGAFKITVGGIVIVCSNTWAMNEASAQITARLIHRGDLKAEVRDRLRMIREVQQTMQRQDEECNQMAATKLTDDDVQHLVAGTYPIPKPPRALSVAARGDDFKAAAARAEGKRIKGQFAAYESTRERIELYRNGVLTEYGKFNDDTRRVGRGTAWGYFNACTSYIDHVQTIKGSDESRALYKAFGDGAEVKSRAYDLCVAMAKKG